MNLAPFQRHLPRFSDLPLFWKLLVPFLVLILVVGAASTYLIVRELSSKARVEMNQELLRHSLDAGSRIHDRELYLLESVNFAANLHGMADAVKAKNAGEAARLLRSVLALKTDLHLLAVTLPDGRSLVEFVRATSDDAASEGSGTAWGDTPIVAGSLPGKGEQKIAGFVQLGDRKLLAIAAPICSGAKECASVGSALVGFDVGLIASEAGGDTSAEKKPTPAVSIYDEAGDLVAATGKAPTGRVPAATDLVRRTEQLAGREFFTLYSPLELQGRRAGMLAVSLPAESALRLARGAGLRLALVVFLGMAGVVAVGALLSRYVLAHIRSLVETSRSLGQGDLAARTPVVAGDELGELAEVLNQMAYELQASHETLEMRVEERTSEVRRLLQERTDFFAGISHELKTPIAVILNQARMLLSSIKSNRKRMDAERVEMILQSADQLLARVNDILEFARAESGRIEVTVSDVAVPELFDEIRPTIHGLASAGGHTVETELAIELPLVRADASRLKDVVMNLVDNAVKYTPTGGKIGVFVAAHNGKVELSITDSGPGIPAEVGNRIFEPFYRVPGTQTQRGQASSGLGLALTKRLVEAQGGKISFESRRGRGTTFTVSLRPSRTKARGRKT